eukprot:2200478-Rhodomonas_salina.2
MSTCLHVYMFPVHTPISTCDPRSDLRVRSSNSVSNDRHVRGGRPDEQTVPQASLCLTSSRHPVGVHSTSRVLPLLAVCSRHTDQRVNQPRSLEEAQQ